MSRPPGPDITRPATSLQKSRTHLTENGRTKTITLRVGEVAAGLARYELARAELDARAAAGLAGLRQRRAARRNTP